ncbi:MAG: nickel pincer cofactor-dependent isomerase, group 22 [Chloroflexota bacterium]
MNTAPHVTFDSSPVTAQMATTPLPRLLRVRQRFAGPQVDDVPVAVRAELARAGLAERIRPGQRVAIAIGSRGISSIAQVAKTIIDEVRRLGAEPFVVPAMGSHGGGTAEGQQSILEAIGVSEATVGAPILASMDVVRIGTLPRGMPVYADKHACGADAIILLNRIKPHSPWGHIGSGLMKIATIGLGKQTGCNTIHTWTIGTDKLYHTIIETFEVVRQRLPIVLGVGIIDNAYARPARILALAPEELPELEPGLRREADTYVPRVPFDHLHVLVVEEIGKNTSPGGLDPLVVGRPLHDLGGNPIAGQPRIQSLVALDLTEQSHGNAVGIGLCDVTTTRLANKINFYDMYLNSLSACRTDNVRLPMALPSDREAIQVAALSCGLEARRQLRLVRVKSTLRLEEFYVSEALLPELHDKANVEPLGELEEWAFDERGNLATHL